MMGKTPFKVFQKISSASLLSTVEGMQDNKIAVYKFTFVRNPHWPHHTIVTQPKHLGMFQSLIRRDKLIFSSAESLCFVIRRDYAIPKCYVIHLCRNHCSCRRSHHRNRKLFVQTLSPLKFTDRLASNCMWGILV